MQTHTRISGRQITGIKTNTIINNLQLQFPFAISQFYPNACGAGMFDDIIEYLLQNTKQDQVDI